MPRIGADYVEFWESSCILKDGRTLRMEYSTNGTAGHPDFFTSEPAFWISGVRVEREDLPEEITESEIELMMGSATRNDDFDDPVECLE